MLGSAQSFANIERARYVEQPWMHDVFPFAQFRGRRVLEIGVGLGTDHMQFARAGALMTGVDLTPLCVELTRRRSAQEGIETDVRIMDAERLEFADDSFDVVYSFGVLHHVPSTEAAIAEVRRVLRPGGVFLGGLYSRESFVYARLIVQWALTTAFLRQSHEALLAAQEHSESGAQPLVRLFGREELRDLLRRAGFESVALQRRHAGLGRLTERLPAQVERGLGRVGGWYLIHQAQ